MPRFKPSVATKTATVPTSSDVQVDTVVMASDAVVTQPPLVEVAEVAQVAQVAQVAEVTQAAETAQATEAEAQATDAVEKKATKESKKVTPKAARRAKTCEKCIARRDREREYARIARSKSRSLKDAKKAAASEAVPATTPEAAEVEGRLNGGMD